MSVSGNGDLAIGSTLGNYRIVSFLGRGGMGAVYVGEHPILGRKAAIKVLLPEYSHNAELVERFFKEARATASLRHHAFVEVFDSGTLPGGSAYLVMELLEGESLGAHLERRGRLPAAEAATIAQHIAEGVGHAHRHGIVHRDLKPDNVFLARGTDPDDPDGVAIKVLDFGIAKLGGAAGGEQGSRTRTGAIMGTPLYMAPEQCRGAGTAVIDHRADVYALGCILHAMIAGRPPFPLEGVGEIIAAHLTTPPPPLRELASDVPPAVEALVLRLLAKRALDRPSGMDEIARALAGLAGGGSGSPAGRAGGTRQMETPRVAAGRTMLLPSASPARARTPGPGTLTGAAGARSVSPPRRRRGWTALLAVGVVAGAAVVGLRVWRPAGTGTAPGAASPAAEPPPLSPTLSPPGGEREKEPAPAPTAPAPPPLSPTLSPPGGEREKGGTEVMVRISSVPPGAEVVDAQSGKRVGETPLEMTVPMSAKSARYSLRKAGFHSKELKVRLDQDAHLDVTLDRRPHPAQAPADGDDDERRKL